MPAQVLLLGVPDILIGTYCALLPMGVFQMLSLENGCTRGSRATICAASGDAALRRSTTVAARNAILCPPGADQVCISIIANFLSFGSFSPFQKCSGGDAATVRDLPLRPAGAVSQPRQTSMRRRFKRKNGGLPYPSFSSGARTFTIAGYERPASRQSLERLRPAAPRLA